MMIAAVIADVPIQRQYSLKLERNTTFSLKVNGLTDGTELLGGTSLLPSGLLSQLALLGVDELPHGVLSCPVESVLPVINDDDGHIVVVHRHQTLAADKTGVGIKIRNRNTLHRSVSTRQHHSNASNLTIVHKLHVDNTTLSYLFTPMRSCSCSYINTHASRSCASYKSGLARIERAKYQP